MAVHLQYMLWHVGMHNHILYIDSISWQPPFLSDLIFPEHHCMDPEVNHTCYSVSGLRLQNERASVMRWALQTSGRRQ